MQLVLHKKPISLQTKHFTGAQVAKVKHLGGIQCIHVFCIPLFRIQYTVDAPQSTLRSPTRRFPIHLNPQLTSSTTQHTSLKFRHPSFFGIHQLRSYTNLHPERSASLFRQAIRFRHQLLLSLGGPTIFQLLILT